MFCATGIKQEDMELHRTVKLARPPRTGHNRPTRPRTHYREAASRERRINETGNRNRESSRHSTPVDHPDGKQPDYNEIVRRRSLLLLPAAGVWAAEAKSAALRGRLRAGEPPTVEVADGRQVPVQGDEEVSGVLRDKRVIGSDFEVLGQMDANGVFQVAPIHENPVFVHKDGQRLYVTYWCDICAIRTRTPGICWCCREDTVLDLRDRKD